MIYIFLIKKRRNIKTDTYRRDNVKNQFVNNLSINDEKLFFFKFTYGSLYSIDTDKMKLIGLLNLNQSTDINPNLFFNSNQIII